MLRRCCLLCVLRGYSKEEPVGLVLSATGSKLLRADTETPLAARPGDLLFSGDGLRTETGPASFLFCPGEGARYADAVRRSPVRCESCPR